MSSSVAWNSFRVPLEGSSSDDGKWISVHGFPNEIPLGSGVGDDVETSPPLIWIHGITSNAKVFASLLREISYPGGSISMDLRGRGDSYHPVDDEERGMKFHLRDLETVMNFFGIRETILVGHSYGGFVALAAARDPSLGPRIRGIVLLDSGFPRTETARGSSEEVKAGLARAFGRLGKTFSSLDDYLLYWYPDGSVTRDSLSVDLRDYYEYDLRFDDEANAFFPKPDLGTTSSDGRELFLTGPTPEDLSSIQLPVVLVRAKDGFTDNSTPLLLDEDVFRMKQSLSIQSYVEVEANHYSMLFDATAIDRTKDAINLFVNQTLL